MVNETMKKYAVGGSAIVLAIAMGLQTFVFGQNDLQALKDSVAKLTERVAQLEVVKVHD